MLHRGYLYPRIGRSRIRPLSSCAVIATDHEAIESKCAKLETWKIV